MKSFLHIPAVAPLILSTAFFTANVAQAQAQTTHETPEIAFKRYFLNKHKPDQPKPAFSASYFLENPNALTPKQRDQVVDNIIDNSGRFSTSLSPAYRIYAEDCARNLGKTYQSAQPAGIREKFYNCLYDTTQLAQIKLQATARTIEQATVAGLPPKDFYKLQVCQQRNGIKPGVRESVDMPTAISTMLCVG